MLNRDSQVRILHQEMRTKRPTKYHQKPANDIGGIRDSFKYDIDVLDEIIGLLSKCDPTTDIKKIFENRQVNDVIIGKTLKETIDNTKDRKYYKIYCWGLYQQEFGDQLDKLDAKKAEGDKTAKSRDAKLIKPPVTHLYAEKGLFSEMQAKRKADWQKKHPSNLSKAVHNK